jgi:membrane protein
MLKERVLSFAMVFVLGFFMLVSLLLSALIAAVSRFVVYQFPAAGWEAANTLISFIAFTGLFSVIFWMLPDVPLRWGDVWSGAVVSSALFILGKFLLGWYIGFSSTFSNYGTAGSFVIILVWVFYSAQILFFGAEFSRAYTLRFGSQCERRKESA